MSGDKIVAFGEILFRISPSPEIHSAEFSMGGAELNVATALGAWGKDVAYISRMPDNILARSIEKLVSGNGIDTSRMLWGGDRIGIYYMTPGSDMQSLSVVYDRKYSSFSQLTTGMVDWDKCLEGTKWLHWTAITPALNADAAAVCEEMLIAARKLNITISTDLNYRRLLWKYGKSPKEVMPSLVKYCDVIMGNIWSASDMLDVHWKEDELVRGNKDSCNKIAAEVAGQIISQFPQCSKVAFTFRFAKPDGSLDYFATLYNTREIIASVDFYTDTVVDSVGSGDCFMAGLIYGTLEKMTDQNLINFAAASAVSKLKVKGDANRTSVADILSLI
ncbi:MAG: sugar kinase [Chitinophagaceae bacterium]